MARRYLFSLLFSAFSLSIFGQFTDVIEESGLNHHHQTSILIGGGAAFFDYNNDGWLDLYLSGGQEGDKLFQNDSKGSFIDVSQGSNITFFTENSYTFGVAYGDINNDGCQDLFLYTYERSVKNKLLLNNCEGRFIEITTPANLVESSSSSGAAFIDFDNDSFLDLYVVNYIDEFIFIADENGVIVDMERYCFPNFFYRNNGNLTFTEVSDSYSLNDAGCGLAVLPTDYDLDGDQDLYLANDHGQFVYPNVVFRNANKTLFPLYDNGMDIGIYAMGIGSGDFDEDGDFDYYITNIGNNALLRNNRGRFERIDSAMGVSNGRYENGNYTTGWGANFFDYDNDTDLDLFVSNGYIEAGYLDIFTSLSDTNKFYESVNGEFIDRSVDFNMNNPAINRGSITGDYDNDGDLDLFVVSIGDGTYKSNLYRNDNSNGINFLKLKLEGTVSNRNAFGSVVRVYSEGRMFIRELSSGGSHASQGTDILHYGLGSNTKIDSVVITWPNGESQMYPDIPENELIYFLQGETSYEILGCTNPDNARYNPNATKDYGCEYEVVFGCTVRSSLSYNPRANAIDNSCNNLTIPLSVDNETTVFKAYPNPTSGLFTVLSREQSISKIIVYNLGGQKIISDSFRNEIEIDLTSYPTGIYLIELISDNHREKIKVLVQ